MHNHFGLVTYFLLFVSQIKEKKGNSQCLQDSVNPKKKSKYETNTINIKEECCLCECCCFLCVLAFGVGFHVNFNGIQD